MEPPRSSVVTDIFNEPNKTHATFMDQIRRAATSPSPIADLLEDPRVLRSLARPKPRRMKTTGSEISLDSVGTSTSHTHTNRSHHSSTHSLLTMALEAEGRQSTQLKSALLNVGGRLEEEIRRGDNVEVQLERAIIRARQCEARASASELARHESELVAMRANEEVRRVNQQLEHARRELDRAQSIIDDLARARDTAIESAHKSREIARQYQLVLKEIDARLLGREEGRKTGQRDVFVDEGRIGNNWAERVGGLEAQAQALSTAQVEAWLRGTGNEPKDGATSDWQRGLQQGVMKERHNAMQAFERFLESHGRKLGGGPENESP